MANLVRILVGSSYPHVVLPSRMLLLGPRQSLPRLEEAVVSVSGLCELDNGISVFTWCVGSAPGADDLMACRRDVLAKYAAPC